MFARVPLPMLEPPDVNPAIANSSRKSFLGETAFPAQIEEKVGEFAPGQIHTPHPLCDHVAACGNAR
jgi:hypothetical protein